MTLPRKTSLEDLGAATCKDFVDYRAKSPLEVLWKSFRSSSEVLQKCSTAVASVTDTHTNTQTDIWTSRAAVAAKKGLKVLIQEKKIIRLEFMDLISLLTLKAFYVS